MSFKVKKVITSHISDTHGIDQINCGSGNILFHHGDATNKGTTREFENFNRFLESKLNDFDHIVYVPGNHDILLERDEQKIRSIFSNKRIHLLINESIDLCGFKIYGSPYSITYGWGFAFMKHGEDLFKEWEKIPKDVDILITHSPPFGVLDYASLSTGNLGCSRLRWKIDEEFKKLKLHGFGHIHESNGFRKIGKKSFVNASIAGSFNSGPFDAWVLTWANKRIIDAKRLDIVD